MYVLVEFTEPQGSIAIVHKSWITPFKKETYWPPSKDKKVIDKLLLRGETVEKGKDWKIFQLKKCVYETDNFAKAKEKLKQFEETSDIQTDYEENIKKRKRLPPRKLSYGSSDSSDSELHVSKKQDLPQPPKIKERLLRDVFNTEQRLTNIDVNHSNTPTSATSACATPSDGEAIYQKIFAYLIKIHEQNVQILNWIRSQEIPQNLNISLDTIPVELPIGTEENLQRFEQFISKKENFDKLVKYFSTLGGNGHIKKTNRILRHLIKDEVASRYNFYGKRNQKLPFHSLELKKLIIKSIQLSSHDITEKQVEDSIKIWLKHAPERVKHCQK